MAVGADRVQLLKQETTALGGTGADSVDYPSPINPQTDAVETAGVFLQDATARDENVYVARQANDMIFRDLVLPTPITLYDLAVGAYSRVDIWADTNVAQTGLAAIDGVTPTAGMRVLCSGQTTTSQDGIWAAAAGAWTRVEDCPVGKGVAGLALTIKRGTAHKGKLVVCTSLPGSDVVGTNDLTFAPPPAAATPGGSNTQVQYNNAGAFAGAAKFSIGSLGNPEFEDNIATALPTPPAEAAGILLYNRVVRHHRQLRVQQAEHREFMLQGGLGDKAVNMVRANAGAASFSVIGTAQNATGTVTLRTPATTNKSTRIGRTALVSAATAGASAGLRRNVLEWTIGGDSGGAVVGGFRFKTRFILDTVPATYRWFVGVNAAAAVIGNVNPSTLVNMIAFGCDVGQTTVRLLQCGAANPANFTSTDLGANFPSATAGTVYEAEIVATPLTGRISVSLLNLSNGSYFEDQISTNLPANTVLLAWQLWCNNGTTAAASAIAIASVYGETDL